MGILPNTGVPTERHSRFVGWSKLLPGLWAREALLAELANGGGGLWQDPGYVPAPSDIILFDWELDGTSDHVGIVEYVEGEVVHTVGDCPS